MSCTSMLYNDQETYISIQFPSQFQKGTKKICINEVLNAEFKSHIIHVAMHVGLHGYAQSISWTKFPSRYQEMNACALFYEAQIKANKFCHKCWWMVNIYNFTIFIRHPKQCFGTIFSEHMIKYRYTMDPYDYMSKNSLTWKSPHHLIKGQYKDILVSSSFDWMEYPNSKTGAKRSEWKCKVNIDIFMDACVLHICG